MQIINVSRSREKLMLSMVNRLRRLLRNVLRAMKLPSVISSSDVAKAIHDIDLRGVIRRQSRAQQADESRHYNRNQPNPRCDYQGEETEKLGRMGERKNHQPSQKNSDDAASQR